MGLRSLRAVIVLITLVVSTFFTMCYGGKMGVFYGDAGGYYAYLPSAFIYHNLMHMDVLPEGENIPDMVRGDAELMGKNNRSPKGYAVDQYTCGVALMEMPFFLVAHAYALMAGEQANGYSAPYKYAVKLSSVVYSLLGLLLVYKVLRNYSGKTLSLLVVCNIFLGTNLFWFTLCQAGMSHIPVFFLYALLIFLTVEIHRRPTYLLFIITGCTAGLITIIRPTDILCLLIPLLYSIYDKESLKNKLHFISGNYRGIIVAGIAFVIPLFPQLLYWKVLTGDFFYYSYGQQTFNWAQPKIIEGLFYFKNGWLPYSLVMVFALAGLFLYRHIKPWAWCLWLTLPVYIYIIYSWYCYNYINGLGSRPMIHMYPLLAIPFAAFLRMAGAGRPIAKYCVALFCVFFISVNISNSMQESKRILFSEDSNMEFNLQTLYRSTLRYKDFVCMDNGIKQPGNDEVTKVSTLGCEQYDDSVSSNYIKDDKTGLGYFYDMHGDEEHQAKCIKVKYYKDKFRGAKWFKCSGRFNAREFTDYYGRHLLTLDVKHNGEFILWKSCKIDNKIGLVEDSLSRNPEINIDHMELNKWGYVYFYVRIPGQILDGDEITLDVWNVGRKEMYMDDICLELYK